VERCQARYAWIQHAAIAASVGVTDAEIAALERGELPMGLVTATERTALAFADEMLHAPRASDELFARLQVDFSSREIVELLLTVGYFRMISSLMTTLDIELEPAFSIQTLG
jgi:alkylhydroperoxidase family enzyme